MSQQAIVNGYFESTAEFWRRIYEQDDIGSRIYQTRYWTVLNQVDRLALPVASKVLEVGCGAGHTTASLAERGFVVDALDAARAMADQTRERVERLGFSGAVETGVGDIYRLPYQDGAFALVVAIGVLPWLQDRESAVKELARVVRPGGHVLLTMDNSRSLSRLLDPSLHPLVLPVKRAAARIAGRLGLRSITPQAAFCSNRSIDRAVARQGLRKVWSATVGFGPLTFFNRPLLGGAAAVKFHVRLQEMADKGVIWARGAGSHYLVLAQRACD